jgi:hypothetical protein
MSPTEGIPAPQLHAERTPPGQGREGRPWSTASLVVVSGPSQWERPWRM